MKNKLKILIGLAIILFINFALAAHMVEEGYQGSALNGGLFGLMSGNYGNTGMIVGWAIGILVVVILISIIIWIFSRMKK